VVVCFLPFILNNRSCLLRIVPFLTLADFGGLLILGFELTKVVDALKAYSSLLDASSAFISNVRNYASSSAIALSSALLVIFSIPTVETLDIASLL